jgi:hypothetical protein
MKKPIQIMWLLAYCAAAPFLMRMTENFDLMMITEGYSDQARSLFTLIVNIASIAYVLLACGILGYITKPTSK